MNINMPGGLHVLIPWKDGTFELSPAFGSLPILSYMSLPLSWLRFALYNNTVIITLFTGSINHFSELLEPRVSWEPKSPSPQICCCLVRSSGALGTPFVAGT